MGDSTSAAARNLRADAVMTEPALRSSAVRARFRVAARTVATRPPPDVLPRAVVRERVEATPPMRGRAAEEARAAFIISYNTRCFVDARSVVVSAENGC